MTQPTTLYSRGDIVLVDFFFSDGSGAKRRPAVVISSTAYHRSRREAIIAAITSNTTRALVGDQPIADWKQSGLLFPSVVTGLLGAVRTDRIQRKIGSLSPADLSRMNETLRRALDL